MKNLVKRLIRYDYRYTMLSQSFLYKMIKKMQARLFARLYGNPSRDFFIIGVTGTNGKTTTCMLLHKIFNALVGKTLAVTTEGVYIGTQKFETGKKMTSYDPATLQKILATAKAEGCKIAVIEVSSHGMDQSRFDAVDFDLAVLTNLRPEHLDYHKTMSHYAEAKKKLFTGVIHNSKKNTLAVFPKDDEYGRAWSEELAFDRAMTYGIVSSAAMKASNIQVSHHGTSFTVQYLGVDHQVNLQLLGEYNVSNALAALSAAVLTGISLPQAITVLSDFVGVTGRLEQLVHNDVMYYVDYCHNADGLQKSLQFLSKLKGHGRLLVMFGLAGHRDIGQRALAGTYVQEYSDLFVLTEDDSDTENRSHIMDAITKGITEPEGDRFFVIPERHFAMQFVVDMAQPGDTVLIAGKGHETKLYSYYGTREWSDMKELKKMLSTA